MKPSKPPTLATWLLEHICSNTNADALAGDLLEEYNRRRSAAWYWRQVLIGIVTSCASEVRHHRLLATQAIVITWAAGYGALLLGRWLVVEFFMHGVLQPALALWVICLLGALVSGLIVALLNRRHRNAVLLTSAATLLGWGLLESILLNKGGSLQQNLVFAIIYYLVAVPGFTIGGFLFTRVPKTPQHRKRASPQN
jgi:hypothetical protein